jgi:hypothetical protein
MPGTGFNQAGPAAGSPESLGYKTLVVLMSQTGTNAPTVHECVNTLGETASYFYDGVGTFHVNAPGCFVEDKTTFFSSQLGNPLYVVEGLYDDNDNYIITTSNNNVYANGLLTDTTIEIRVYP